MTRTSDIVPYIEKYKAGEVVDRNPEAVYDAIVKMRKSYSIYLDGVKNLIVILIAKSITSMDFHSWNEAYETTEKEFSLPVVQGL